MATKKNKGAETETTSTASPRKRDEILNADLVAKYLAEEGLAAGGTLVEQADRLENHFEHEHRKAGEGPEAMLECLPPQRKDQTFDEEGNLGCYRSSPAHYSECPFCGMSEVLTTAPKPSEKKSGKKGAKKDDSTKGELEILTDAMVSKQESVEDKAETAEEPKLSTVVAAVIGKKTTDERDTETVVPPVADESVPGAEEPPAPSPEAPAPGGVVKTNAKKIRQGKGKKGAEALTAPALDVTAEDEAPNEETKRDEPIVRSDVATSEPVAAETENSEPPEGATVADLDRECARVTNAQGLAERTTALSMWEQGDAIRAIHEKKLWCLERNEDGSPVYRSFGEFTARKFDMSAPTAYSYKRVAEVFDRPTVEALGFSRMKELLSAQDLPSGTLRALVSRALTRTENGSAFVLSVRELRDEVAKEKRMLASPPAPTTPATAPKPPPVESDDSDDGAPGDLARDEENDAPPPSNRVDHDEDGVVREDEEDDRPRTRAPEPKTVTLSLAEPKITIPLYRKGSSVKPAKKIEDGCHGTFHGINGATVKVEVVIGEGAELQIVMTVERPR